jgi:hypothetical protein
MWRRRERSTRAAKCDDGSAKLADKPGLPDAVAFARYMNSARRPWSRAAHRNFAAPTIGTGLHASAKLLADWPAAARDPSPG